MVFKGLFLLLGWSVFSGFLLQPPAPPSVDEAEML